MIIPKNPAKTIYQRVTNQAAIPKLTKFNQEKIQERVFAISLDTNFQQTVIHEFNTDKIMVYAIVDDGGDKEYVSPAYNYVSLNSTLVTFDQSYTGVIVVVSGSAIRVPDTLVTGPASSVDGEIVVFDGVTGKFVKKGGETIESLRKYVINSQADSYTLALTDAYKLIKLTKATANTLTVPKNSVVAFEIGTRIDILQYGAGTVTIDPVDGDVTINQADSAFDIGAQYSVISLVKIDTNEWVLVGNLA